MQPLLITAMQFGTTRGEQGNRLRHHPYAILLQGYRVCGNVIEYEVVLLTDGKRRGKANVEKMIEDEQKCSIDHLAG